MAAALAAAWLVKRFLRKRSCGARFLSRRMGAARFVNLREMKFSRPGSEQKHRLRWRKIRLIEVIFLVTTRVWGSDSIMSATFQYDPSTQLVELHIRGTLKRAEFAESERELERLISGGASPRILVICENFGGWERGHDWNNLDFMFSHGAKIAKIAVVGAGTKEDEVRAFTGAGMRPTPIRFFDAGEATEATVWLLD